MQVHTLLRNLKKGETYRHARVVTIDGCRVRLSATLSTDGEKVIVVCNDLAFQGALALYARRWEIETLFSALKSRGLGIEDTHLSDPDRVSRLVAVCALAFCWAYRMGIEQEKNQPYQRNIKKHGRPQQNLFSLGLDAVVTGMKIAMYRRANRIMHCLASYLTPQPIPIWW